MSCKDYQKQIISYLDGELPQDMADVMNQHIMGCENCKSTFENLINAYILIESEKSEYSQNELLAVKVLAKIKSNKIEYSSNIVSLRYYTIIGLAAAGIAIGIFIGSLYSTSSTIKTTTTQEWDQLADEYMPEIDNNPYNLITITNETPTKP
jgi:anti-sigma factor RsiW